MKQTINVHDFREAFRVYGRNETFTYEGLGALFDYIEELEEDIGEEIELDVIALCCDYSEWESLDEFNDYYGKDTAFTLEDVSELTAVIDINGTRFITQDF